MSERFAAGTQVYSKLSGWKDMRNLVPEEEILQYLPETQELEFAPIAEIQDREMRDSLIKISGKDNYAMQLVSAEHRVAFEYRNSAGEWRHKVCLAKDLYNNLRQHRAENLRLRTCALLPEDYEEILGDKTTRFISGEELEIVEDSRGGETVCVKVPSTFLITRFLTKKDSNPVPVISGNCL